MGCWIAPPIQARLALPPDQVVTHPETGTTRALFDCQNVALTAIGPRIRVIVATHKAPSTPVRIGKTHEGVVYELFWTCLPSSAFTPADAGLVNYCWEDPLGSKKPKASRG